MTTTADDVWRLLGELITAQKETERILKEESQKTDRQIQQLSQQTDLRFQETDRQIQQLSQQADLRFQETDRQIQQLSQQVEKTSQEVEKTSQEIQQLSREVKRVSQEVGNLGSKWGRFLENMVAPACETLFVKRGIPVHLVTQRAKKTLNGKHLEIDVLVTNENHVLVVEVKSSLSVEDVKEFVTDLGEFRQFFPEYNQKQLYGAVAGIEIDRGADKYAYRQGLFVLAQSGETVTILNDEKFQPKVW